MECSAIPAKVIATCFAVVAFVAALTVGAAVGNPTTTILYRAVLTMLICWLIGYAVGAAAQRVNERAIQQYQAEHPIEDSAADADGAEPGSPNPQDVTADKNAAVVSGSNRNSPSRPLA